MKNLVSLAVLGTFVAVSSSAFATTIQLGSYATGSSNLGNANTAMNYAGFIEQDNGPYPSDPGAAIASGTNNTYTAAPGLWAGPITNSTWISNTAGASGGVYSGDLNGYYTYTTNFTAPTADTYNATISLLADDTVAVYLNGVLEVPAGFIGSDAKCADGDPNCRGIESVGFIGNLVTGTNANTLTFVVEQTGLSSQGMDFSATLTPTPEPGSLILLGSGLVGAAGMFFRRRAHA